MIYGYGLPVGPYSDGRLPPSFTIIACGEIGADAASTSAFPTLD
jgi:hypothetical protein